jgi:hypothetical protein
MEVPHTSRSGNNICSANPIHEQILKQSARHVWVLPATSPVKIRMLVEGRSSKHSQA